ncbi:hypothetical protein [Chromobacterium phragmitis]|uniref:hypothetical protein n=1 Tax=Chromobacterium phragmitis TaxID=2202141 RepID=UPI0011AE8C32|nr:hypothetical protein [Chromobacterium phragmitis]
MSFALLCFGGGGMRSIAGWLLSVGALVFLAASSAVKVFLGFLFVLGLVVLVRVCQEADGKPKLNERSNECREEE